MKIKLTAIMFLIPLIGAIGQYAKRGISVSLSVNYTSTSRLFLNPKSADRFVRETYEPLDNIYHYNLELRYRIDETIAIGLNVDYIRKTYRGKNVSASSPSGIVRIDVEDGYLIIPVEINLIYLLPFSTEKLKFYSSGGVGFYFGKHIRNFGTAEIESDIEGFPFGIQVEVGMEYMIFDYLSARFNMRFRDPEVSFKSTYKNKYVVYNGTNLLLPVDSFYSKVNIDGVTFGLGLAYQL